MPDSMMDSVMENHASICWLPLTMVRFVIGVTWSPAKTGISPMTPETGEVMVQKPRFTLARLTPAWAWVMAAFA